MSRIHRLLAAAVAVVMLAAVAPIVSVSAVTPADEAPPRPMVFVHGFSGSGNQFESQSLRFASNGYPLDHIVAFEWDSFGSEPAADRQVRLDGVIDDLLDATGADQVDLLGHSAGTGISQGYLNSHEDRAARVAHYVNLDGTSAAALPGGVPTLAVWGIGSPTRAVVGATNIYFDDQSHTEVVTSPETFAEAYKFFNDGAEPFTTEIVRADSSVVAVSGKVLRFISNDAPDDATLDVYEIDGSTGFRTDVAPLQTWAISGDGAFGPFAAEPGAHYEFALSQTGGASVQHFYLQPFVRSTHLVRLLTSEPGESLDAIWDKDEGHSNIVFLRNKEFWGDQGADNDSLVIDGTEVMNAATAPVASRIIAMFAYDVGADGESDATQPIAAFAGVPFVTGVDLHIPASTPPDRTVAMVSTPRGGVGPEVINVPNWGSDVHRNTVQFRDFHVTRAERPTEPQDVTAVGGPLQATVSWSPPADPGVGDLISYQVSDEGGLLMTVTPDVTTVDVIGLDEGSEHSFSVQAVASNGGGAVSALTPPVVIAGPPADYDDVAPDHVFGPEIMWAAARGLAGGFPDGTFRPVQPVTRQAAAAFLYRLAGEPEGPFDDPDFSDVDAGHPFATEIAWMVDAGLADGFADGTFRPTRPVTRQAAMAFLYRMAGEPEVEWPPGIPIPVDGAHSSTRGAAGADGRTDMLIYTDVPNDHPFLDAIVWGSTRAITTGFPDGSFRPSGDVTRQAMVTFMYRTTLRVGLLS